MSALARLQRDFQTHVLKGAAANLFADSIVGDEIAESSERLNVYSHAYVARLQEVLENEFLGLRAFAGDDAFDELTRAYVEATPSSYFNVRWYGEVLAAFLRTTPPWSQTPAYAEMAGLDWIISLSFDAADDVCIGESDIAAIPPQDWPAMHFRLRGSIRRLALLWNVGDIRRASDRDDELPILQKLDAAQPWIVSRQDYVVRYRALDMDESAALDSVERGATFAELCEVLCEWHAPDVVAMRVATLLKAWVQNQWISEVMLGDAS